MDSFGFEFSYGGSFIKPKSGEFNQHLEKEILLKSNFEFLLNFLFQKLRKFW
jgi:hypothetical protein